MPSVASVTKTLKGVKTPVWIGIIGAAAGLAYLASKRNSSANDTTVQTESYDTPTPENAIANYTGPGGFIPVDNPNQSSSDTTALTPKVPAKIVLYAPSTLNINETYQLKTMVYAKDGSVIPDADVLYLSLNPAVVGIDGNEVYGKNGGTADVVAVAGLVQDRARVTVPAAPSQNPKPVISNPAAPKPALPVPHIPKPTLPSRPQPTEKVSPDDGQYIPGYPNGFDASKYHPIHTLYRINTPSDYKRNHYGGKEYYTRNMSGIAIFGGTQWIGKNGYTPSNLAGRTLINQYRVSWGLRPLTNNQFNELVNDMGAKHIGRDDDSIFQFFLDKWNKPFRYVANGAGGDGGGFLDALGSVRRETSEYSRGT